MAKALKVLKVLKVLNFSGAGTSNIFTCTFTRKFTGGVAEGMDPASRAREYPLALRELEE